jgi:hypothetical protein
MNVRRLASYRQFFAPGFLAWLADNPTIYDDFERHALVMLERGRQHFSARTIVEDMRHFSRLRDSDGTLKINDHRAPDLARVFAILHPQHALLWEYRRDDWKEFLAAVGTQPPEPPQRDMFGFST